MPEYKAPLRDIKFVMNELLNSEQHYANLEGAEDATPDMVDAIIQEGAKFCEQVLSPLGSAVMDGQPPSTYCWYASLKPVGVFTPSSLQVQPSWSPTWFSGDSAGRP